MGGQGRVDSQGPSPPCHGVQRGPILGGHGVAHQRVDHRALFRGEHGTPLGDAPTGLETASARVERLGPGDRRVACGDVHGAMLARLEVGEPHGRVRVQGQKSSRSGVPHLAVEHVRASQQAVRFGPQRGRR
jgi:hypothetical protein